MVVSRKHSPLQPISQLNISSRTLDRVSEFKYLGIWLTENLSWSKHIEHITKSTARLIGMIYRRFYVYSTSNTLKKLYITKVRPHLEYAAPVWDPHGNILISSLERVQNFALKMYCRDWNGTYLLQASQLPSLKKCKKLLKLSYLFQVQSGAFFFFQIPQSPALPLTLD